MRLIIFIILILLAFGVSAQIDSIKILQPVEVKGYYNQQPLLRSTGAVSLLDSTKIKMQSNTSFVGLINTVAGVRMEERSPGSYRLSLRGSLLRSPFGIRNVKIYFNDFPLTDAGGNSYMNLLDPLAVTNLEIYKGPEASNFGANTGGVVIINSTINPINSIKLSVDVGSFGLFHQTLAINQNKGKYHFNLLQGYQRSNGYRANSALNRKYFQTNQLWNYSSQGSIKAFLFYCDLQYQTPGGLTLSQWESNPKASRPATFNLPSALAQQAAIYNKTFFAGLSHQYLIHKYFKHVVALFGTHTDFKNPFITNYEKRWENNLGLRSFLAYDKRSRMVDLSLQFGVETAAAYAHINNFENAGGEPGKLQATDHLTARQSFAFLRANVDIHKKLLIEMGASLNFYNYHYESLFPIASPQNKKTFNKVLMPKIALSYLVDSIVTLRASVSKGYSPPTIAEVRASDQMINLNLQSENGWNHELGLRLQAFEKKLFVDGSLFYFNLKDAIVRRLNPNDTEYFVNAGGTKQLGTELQLNYWLLQKQKKGFLRGLLLSSAFTYSYFKFKNFENAGNDYTGNDITGVPKHNIVNSLTFNFKQGFYLFLQHNYVSRLPLNDANTAFASPYHLTDFKFGKDFQNLKTNWNINFGIHNLLNQRYSLGNDLNAVGGRYYNPAAVRNYYLGLSLMI